jgi:hypothetical protein
VGQRPFPPVGEGLSCHHRVTRRGDGVVITGGTACVREANGQVGRFSARLHAPTFVFEMVEGFVDAVEPLSRLVDTD